MVFLYNRLGDWMFFSADGWNEVLANARTYGWQPAGTQPPPAPFNAPASQSETITWDGNYTRPLGQYVGPDDAIALGAAIERALQRAIVWEKNRAAVVRALPSFCRQRGFLVSANVFMGQSASANDAAPARDIPRQRVAS